MTAEGPTGARSELPLRQQIAEAAYHVIDNFVDDGSEESQARLPYELADAVVAILNEDGRPFVYGDRVKSLDTCLQRKPRIRHGWWNIQDGCWSSYDDDGIRSEMRAGRLRPLGDDESSVTFRED